jgi:Protein of unknown function (DUF2877)
MKFDASHIGMTARRLMRPGMQFRIHSQFESGVNLVAGDDELVFVTTAPECAPWAVNAPGMPVDLIGTQGAQHLIARVNTIDVLVFQPAPVAIDLRPAQIWTGDPIRPLASRDAIRAALAQACLPRFPPGLTGCGLEEADLVGPPGVWTLVGSYLQYLASRLIGLGRGLTPSGDDFLTGLFGTLALTIRPGFSLEFERRTTLISRTQLSHALRGELPEVLHNVIRALVHADASISAAVRRLRSFGHTSGLDMLAGVRLGFELVTGNAQEEKP